MDAAGSRRRRVSKELGMFSKLTVAAAAAAVAVTAMPAAPAEARHRDYRYQDSYRGDYDRGGQYRDRYQRGDNYYGRNQAYYGDRNYNGRRCSGTTGTIVGGVAGALLGREIARGN